MSYFAATPDAFSAVSSELTSIGSAIRQAHVAAATWTTQVEFAAGDEVSAAIAELFGGYAQQYQALAAQAAAFHDPVSYTHLDVYKRQGHAHLGQRVGVGRQLQQCGGLG